MASGPVRASLLMVGTNHRTAPIEVREEFALSGERLSKWVDRLVEQSGVSECVVLSTCHRTECYVTGTDPILLEHVVRERLCAATRIGEEANQYLQVAPDLKRLATYSVSPAVLIPSSLANRKFKDRLVRRIMLVMPEHLVQCCTVSFNQRSQLVEECVQRPRFPKVPRPYRRQPLPWHARCSEHSKAEQYLCWELEKWVS